MTSTNIQHTELEINILAALVENMGYQLTKLIQKQKEKEQHLELPQLTQKIEEVQGVRLKTLKELERLTRIASLMRKMD